MGEFMETTTENTLLEKRLGPGAYKNLDPKCLKRNIQCNKFSEIGRSHETDSFMDILSNIRPLSANISMEAKNETKFRIYQNSQRNISLTPQVRNKRIKENSERQKIKTKAAKEKKENGFNDKIKEQTSELNKKLYKIKILEDKSY